MYKKKRRYRPRKKVVAKKKKIHKSFTTLSRKSYTGLRSKRDARGVMRHFIGGKPVSAKRAQAYRKRRVARKNPPASFKGKKPKAGSGAQKSGKWSKADRLRAARAQANQYIKNLKNKTKPTTFTIGGFKFYAGKVKGVFKLISEDTYKARKKASRAAKKAAPKKKAKKKKATGKRKTAKKSPKKKTPKRKSPKKKTAKRKSPKRKTAKRKTAKRKAPKRKPAKKRKATAKRKKTAAAKRQRKYAYAKRASNGVMKYFSRLGKPISKAAYQRSLKARKKGKKMAKRKKGKKLSAHAKRKRAAKAKRSKGRYSKVRRKKGGARATRKGARTLATRKYKGQRVRLMGGRRFSKKTNKELKPWFGIRRNPTLALKQAFVNAGMTFAGIMGTRAISNFAAKYILFNDRAASAAGATPVVTKLDNAVRSMFLSKNEKTGKNELNTLGYMVPALPAGLILLGTIFGGKVLARLGESAAPMIQQGAAISFLEQLTTGALAAFDTNHKLTPYLNTNYTITMSQKQGALSEYVEWGGQGYGEYLEEGAIHPDYDMGGYGVDVEEALAEYVSDPNQELVTGNPGQDGYGYGVDVEEALADDEVDAFQTGYASGTLARSVFSV